MDPQAVTNAGGTVRRVLFRESAEEEIPPDPSLKATLLFSGSTLLELDAVAPPGQSSDNGTIWLVDQSGSMMEKMERNNPCSVASMHAVIDAMIEIHPIWSANGIPMEVIAFSSYSYHLTTFPITQQSVTDDMKGCRGSSTNFDHAFESAKKIMDTCPGTFKEIVLITDGQSPINWSNLAQIKASAKVSVLGVGLIDSAQLNKIATSPSDCHVFTSGFDMITHIMDKYTGSIEMQVFSAGVLIPAPLTDSTLLRAMEQTHRSGGLVHVDPSSPASVGAASRLPIEAVRRIPNLPFDTRRMFASGTKLCMCAPKTQVGDRVLLRYNGEIFGAIVASSSGTPDGADMVALITDISDLLDAPSVDSVRELERRLATSTFLSPTMVHMLKRNLASLAAACEAGSSTDSHSRALWSITRCLVLACQFSSPNSKERRAMAIASHVLGQASMDSAERNMRSANDLLADLEGEIGEDDILLSCEPGAHALLLLPHQPLSDRICGHGGQITPETVRKFLDDLVESMKNSKCPASTPPCKALSSPINLTYLGRSVGGDDQQAILNSIVRKDVTPLVLQLSDSPVFARFAAKVWASIASKLAIGFSSDTQDAAVRNFLTWALASYARYLVSTEPHDLRVWMAVRPYFEAALSERYSGLVRSLSAMLESGPHAIFSSATHDVTNCIQLLSVAQWMTSPHEELALCLACESLRFCVAHRKTSDNTPVNQPFRKLLVDLVQCITSNGEPWMSQACPTIVKRDELDLPSHISSSKRLKDHLNACISTESPKNVELDIGKFRSVVDKYMHAGHLTLSVDQIQQGLANSRCLPPIYRHDVRSAEALVWTDRTWYRFAMLALECALVEGKPETEPEGVHELIDRLPAPTSLSPARDSAMGELLQAIASDCLPALTWPQLDSYLSCVSAFLPDHVPTVVALYLPSEFDRLLSEAPLMCLQNPAVKSLVAETAPDEPHEPQEDGETPKQANARARRSLLQAKIEIMLGKPNTQGYPGSRTFNRGITKWLERMPASLGSIEPHPTCPTKTVKRITLSQAQSVRDSWTPGTIDQLQFGNQKKIFTTILKGGRKKKTGDGIVVLRNDKPVFVHKWGMFERSGYTDTYGNSDRWPWKMVGSPSSISEQAYVDAVNATIQNGMGHTCCKPFYQIR